MFADAEAYERFMGRWSRMLARELVNFAELPGTGWFLDAGSGTGALTFTLAELHPEARVHGIDPSREYVGYAAGRNRLPGRASFATGDVQAVPCDAATFDAALSLLVFNFIPDPARAIGEIRRVTKPGGGITAAVWDYGAEMEMLRVFWDAAVGVDRAAEVSDESRMPLCRRGELEALWREGGLEGVTACPLVIRMQFASFADYWEPFLLGQGPAGGYVRKIGAAHREALRTEVKRRLRVQSEGDSFRLTGRAWAARGFVPFRR